MIDSSVLVYEDDRLRVDICPESYITIYTIQACPKGCTGHVLDVLHYDRLRVGWEWCRKSRRCSRDTFPESHITK